MTAMPDAPAIQPVCWQLANDALAWLRAHYAERPYFVERDLVWTLQLWLRAEAEVRALPVDVYHDYPTEPGPRRALSSDIALVGPWSPAPLVLLEFKYEPSHRRRGFTPGKFPVVGWDGVMADMERVARWVDAGRASSGLAVFIDEGGLYRSRAHPGGVWETWGAYGTNELDVWVHRGPSR